MKNYRRVHFIIIFILLASLAVLITHYFISSVEVLTWLVNLAFAVAGFMLCFEMAFLLNINDKKRLALLEGYQKQWNTITYRVKGAGEKAFNELPIGIIVYNENLDIEWANSYAKSIFVSQLFDRNIKNIDKNLSALILAHTSNFDINLYGKIYRCELSVKSRVLYLFDITDQTEIAEQYERRLLTLGVVNLDNYESALGSLDAQEKTQQMSNIIGILSDWAEKYKITIKSYTDERFLLIMDTNALDRLIHNNFTILDEIKDYCTRENLRLSVSMGLAMQDVDTMALMKLADSQLESALNRGGNQVVVNRNGALYYFGAKSEAYDARTSVAVRLKAEELKDIILTYDKVLIMAHKEMDADAFGASIAARAIAVALNKEAHIVFSEKNIDFTVVNVYETIKEEHQNYLQVFLNEKEALSYLDDSTLLIIVDCHSSFLVLDERVEKKAKHIAILDHHRRMSNAIRRFEYSYIQPSASSSVELIVEMFDYFSPYEIEISEIEASWLLMGIVIDTNSFLYRTSSRTYKVLAKLQEYGAQMIKVQNYMRESSEEYTKRLEFLNNLEIINNAYGIVVCDDEIYLRSFIAKIADDAMKMDKIKIAFCLGRISSDTIGISARSYDKANAQIIMERLGGGGHFNNAAAQIQNVDIETAKNMLIQAVKESLAEGDQSMKVILIQNVKGKGKINDIIDVPMGHANFLIRTNQAIEATEDNIKNVERNKMEEKRQQESHLQAMRDLKVKVDSSPITIAVKVGKSGKLFGTVSPKQIIEEMKKQYKIELDRRKIILDKEIDALGTYKVPIQLHKEVTAIIILYVVEME